MNNSFYKFLKISAFALIILSATACGQKGPLEIEQPNQTQEEDQADTI